MYPAGQTTSSIPPAHDGRMIDYSQPEYRVAASIMCHEREEDLPTQLTPITRDCEEAAIVLTGAGFVFWPGESFGMSIDLEYWRMIIGEECRANQLQLSFGASF